MIDNVAALLKLHEGVKNKLYKCPAGYNTIGVGHNLDANPISHEAIDVILRDDIQDCVRTLQRNFPDYYDLSDVRRAVLLDMCFNLGWTGLSKFHNMFAAIKVRDFDAAAKEMLDSKWANQVGLRATRLSVMMRENQWPKA